jgi:hypothetical protein
MLNVGQIVIDLDKKELAIFAGFEMCQSQETGECTAYPALIDRNGKYTCEEHTKETKLHYVNLGKGKDGKIPLGSFIIEQSLGGHYFGIIAEEKLTPEILGSALRAIRTYEEIGWYFDEEGKPFLNEAEEAAKEE